MNRSLLFRWRHVGIWHQLMCVFAFWYLFGALFSKLAFAAVEVEGCGTVGQGILVDYRNAKSGLRSPITDDARTMLRTVENAHFTAEVEALRSGKSVTRPGGDIVYTLERIPNHYRALLSMVALSEREKTSHPRDSTYPVECWFRRAVAVFPDDNTVRMLFAQYLFKQARDKDAEQQLLVASSQAADNPFTLHNIGLVYFDAKNYEQALVHAH